MRQKAAAKLLKRLGWTWIQKKAMPEKKCIVLGVPHTAISDWIVAYLYYTALGESMNILIKEDFFKWPFKNWLIRHGGIPVKRTAGGGASTIRQAINAFEKNDILRLGIAPEGTRKPVSKWKTGFHIIAQKAKVPVYLGYFDWGKKEIGYGEKIQLTDDIDIDMKRIQEHYKNLGIKARHPEKFNCGTKIV
ncbi:MAG: 1-acyl-sn-glycerol-3-phosphate acyltransferase [Bacteroidales bacterium]